MGILGGPGIYRGRQLIAYGAARLTGSETIANNTPTTVETLTKWSIIHDVGGFFLANKRINLSSGRTGYLLQATLQTAWQNNVTGAREINYYSALGPQEEFKYTAIESAIGPNILQCTVNMVIEGDNEFSFSVKQTSGGNLNLVGYSSIEVQTHLVGAIFRL